MTSEGFVPPSKRAKRTSIEFYFASDASAMVEHTKRVLHLEDDDVAHDRSGEYGIYRMEKIHSEGEDSPSLATRRR